MLFCVHDYALFRWFYRIDAHDGAIVAVEKCWKCGKLRYKYPKTGSNKERILKDVYTSKKGEPI